MSMTIKESKTACTIMHSSWVVQKVDNAIHRINHYPVDTLVCFVNTYLLDSASLCVG